MKTDAVRRIPCRPVALALAAQILFLSLAASPAAYARAGSSSPPVAYAAEKKCADCRENDGGGDEAPVGAFCSFKYIVYFLWYAVMAVVFVVFVVMDLTTGFTQDYTKDLLEWFREKDSGLTRFFRSLGCG